jgi:hypothetical protein
VVEVIIMKNNPSFSSLRFLSALLTLASLGFFLVGCGSQKKGPPTAKVSGSVNYRNAPVTGGEIVFHYTDGISYKAEIKPDGTFASEGVPPGKVTVTFDTEFVKKQAVDYKPSVKPPPGVEGPPQLDKSKVGTYVRIPAKYTDPKTSPETWDIPADTVSKVFELKD